MPAPILVRFFPPEALAVVPPGASQDYHFTVSAAPWGVGAAAVPFSFGTAFGVQIVGLSSDPFSPNYYATLRDPSGAILFQGDGFLIGAYFIATDALRAGGIATLTLTNNVTSTPAGSIIRTPCAATFSPTLSLTYVPDASATPPSPPTGVGVGTGTGGPVTWSPPATGTGPITYTILQGPCGGTLVSVATGLTGLTYTPVAPNCTTICVSVVAVGPGGSSAPSAPVPVVMPCPSPPADPCACNWVGESAPSCNWLLEAPVASTWIKGPC